MASSKNTKVKSFADMMVSDHAKTTAEVKAAATASGMKLPPPALDEAKAKMIKELQAAKGEQRDQLYLDQQTMAHQEALALHKSYSMTGDSPKLKAVAAKAVPIVQHHIDALRGM